MGAIFDGSTFSRIILSNPIVGSTPTYPILMTAWTRFDNVTVDQTVMSISDAANTSIDDLHLRMKGDVANDPISAQANSGGNSAADLNGGVAGTWILVGALFTSASKRQAILGRTLGTPALTTVSPVGLTTVSLGTLWRNSVAVLPLTGRLAEVAIWYGFDPFYVTEILDGLTSGVRPIEIGSVSSHLGFYQPLVSAINEAGSIGGTVAATNVNWDAAVHPTLRGLWRAQSAVDVVRDLGCQTGPAPSANNAELISGGFTDIGRYGLVVPVCDLEITEPIEIPAQAGFGLRGQASGWIGTDGNGLIGKESRIIGDFDDANGVMIVNKSLMSVVRDLHLLGRRIPAGGSGTEPPTEDQDEALIGIHIRPNDGTNPTSKCIIDNITFQQINTGVLMGLNLDDIGEADYVGDDANNADTVYIGTLNFIHHYAPDSEAHGNTGRSIHIRNNQSVGHYIQRINAWGDPEDVVYIERGGSVVIGQVQCSGSGVGTTTMIHTGNLLDTGIIVHQVYMDATSVGHRLLKMDQVTNYLTPRITILQARIPESNSTVPQLDCGPGVVTLKNTTMLKEGSIKLTGKTLGNGDKLTCHVQLINCMFSPGVAPEDLIDAGSSGPYVLSWRNCQVQHDGASPKIWARPYEDDDIFGGGVTKIPV